MKPFRHIDIAIKQANSNARNRGGIYFVVYEDGYYHVATDEDLNTWFGMVHDKDILYCTAD